MLPIVFACVVGVVLGACAITLIGKGMGDYDDPHDWVMEDEDDIEE